MANNLDKWGRAAARERYGKVKSTDFGKAESSQPQFENDSHGPNYDNDVASQSWLRSNGERKPGFDHSRRGKK